MGCGASTAAGVPDDQLKPVGTSAGSSPAAPAPQPAKQQKSRRNSVEAELDALDDDVAMVVDVESWLTSLNLAEYWTLFENAGYDDLDTVQDMTEEDLVNDVHIVKKGHVKKLLTNIQKLKANSKRSMSSVSIDQVSTPNSTSSPISPTTQPVRRRKGSVEAEIEALEDLPGSLRLVGSEDDASPATAMVEGDEEDEDDIPAAEGAAEGAAKVMPRARKGSVEQEIEALDDFDAPGLLEEEEEEEQEDGATENGAAVAVSTTEAEQKAVVTDDITLDSLREVGTLGVGTFSRVKMVQLKGTNETYALKMMKKTVIEARKQKEHVMNEKNIMLEMTGHPFLLQLRATFKDETYLYMVLELCQGGELFLRLLEEQTLSEDSTRFYTGNIVLALEALHAKDNIYRDLKPENILLDTMGYVKIGDFGFAKKVPDRTFTRCGTPEYVSPEMLGRAGHNKGTDYWSLGIFLYECLHGTTPFAAKNYLSTYKKIAAYSKHCKLKWKADITEEAQELIQKMLHPKPAQRLGNTSGGIDELKGHRWFESLDWDKLYKKELSAPFTPEVKDSTDLTYFNPEEGHHITDKEEGDEYVGDGAWFADF